MNCARHEEFGVIFLLEPQVSSSWNCSERIHVEVFIDLEKQKMTLDPYYGGTKYNKKTTSNYPLRWRFDLFKAFDI